MNGALHYSVTCAEDVPRIAPGEAAAALAGVRTRELAQRLLAVCDGLAEGHAAGRCDRAASPPTFPR